VTTHVVQYTSGQKSEITCETVTRENDGRLLAFRLKSEITQYVGPVIAIVPTCNVMMVHVKNSDQVVFDA
jgi:hypothetical protein